MPGRVQRRSKVRPLARVLPSGSVPSKEAPHGPAWRWGAALGALPVTGVPSAALPVAAFAAGSLTSTVLPVPRAISASPPVRQLPLLRGSCRVPSVVVLADHPGGHSGPAVWAGGSVSVGDSVRSGDPTNVTPVARSQSSPKTQDVVVRSVRPNARCGGFRVSCSSTLDHFGPCLSTFRGRRSTARGAVVHAVIHWSAAVVHGPCTVSHTAQVFGFGLAQAQRIGR